ncbi:erythromycin esterase family protein [Hymenobacter sp. BT683]|uniref:Erythromycin esterase family protein n=1 Tax=Hymenobacter jeongseonensis TaxID=2791027 RepID=A0ABS0IJN3_9BACT|nr:erythromycin esterase family protein [Hymenobacter jeongseonensis]MBF9238558.1 erythromycin esterase family protein [Hymenobacter jeongseonensis]
MLTNFKGFIGLFLCCGLLFSARAQAPASLPVHVVRSIDPADADFQDLEFLLQEIGPARVVMLGEPTHGEGNVFEAKARLIRFLREKMGFTTLAFESGFYDLRKAQQALETGNSAQEALGNSVFGVWTSTQEFQAVLPLVGSGKLRVAGFDPQLFSEGYAGDLVDDLQVFLSKEKGGAALHYDYLEEVISFMGEHFMFLPSTQLADFEKEMAKAQRLVDKAAASTNVARRADAAFWQQCLRSLLAQARDYEAHDSGTKDEKEFKAADSNPRDAQMADNLLWYLRAHPQEKVICWAALPHLANKVEALNDVEIQTFRPMGRAVKAALGPDQVYILGTLAGGGTHGFAGMGGYQPVPPPAAGTLEAELLAQGAEFSFVSLKHDAPGRALTTYAFEYKPLTGPWSEVVDGFLFLRAVNPPHGAKLVPNAPAPPADTAALARAIPGAINPAARPQRVRPGTAGQTIRGTVLDRKTSQPVPYASVSVPGQGVGTVADGQGRFALRVIGTTALQISSVGYATAALTPKLSGEPLTVRLVPAAYELQDVQVRGESLDPRRIMKKVLAALPTNYEQEDYAAEVYTHRRLSHFDTLRYDGEYVSRVFEPAGHRDFNGGFLMRGPRQQHQVREVRVRQPLPPPAKPGALIKGGHGFFTSTADPVRISPLFKTGTWRKFNLRLDSVVERGGETVYIIGFAVRRPTHRSTGTYLQSGYSGRFFVRQQDHAVVHYEALWELDTVKMNAIARKHHPRRDGISQLYTSVYADDRTDHVVDYARGANGRYHVSRSAAQGLSVGRVLRGNRHFHTQMSVEQYFTVVPALAPTLETAPTNAASEFEQLGHTVYHPQFWDRYQLPTLTLKTPAPAAAKP